MPRMDCALHVWSRDPDLSGELRNPDGPDDLGESLLHGETLVDGGQKEGAGKRAVAERLGKIDVPVFTASCRVCPPASHSNSGARAECPDDSCAVVVRPLFLLYPSRLPATCHHIARASGTTAAAAAANPMTPNPPLA